MPEDAFPTTRNTWIDQRLAVGEGGRAEVNAHVMTVYARPLEIYFRGSSWRWLGDAADVVQGFFADRLARDGFFRDWRQSRKPLRRWLLNAFSFYLMELRRSRGKERRNVSLPDDVASAEGNPEEAFDRAFAVSVVRAALDHARRTCDAEGLAEHWTVFLEHNYEGIPYLELAPKLGLEPTRAATMSRTATKRFRAALRDLLARDGLREDAIDGEIHSLLEVTTS